MLPEVYLYIFIPICLFLFLCFFLSFFFLFQYEDHFLEKEAYNSGFRGYPLSTRVVDFPVVYHRSYIIYKIVSHHKKIG